MTTYNTGNPIGSSSAKDLFDNAENLDTAVNDTSRDTWSDRLGRSRKTMSGMERQFDAAEGYREATFVSTQADKQNRFNDFIASSGYQFLGDYAAGIEITEYNQIIRDSDGEFWRLSGQVELPYTTTGDWGDEEPLFVAVGDAVLRQELAAPGGAALVGHGVMAVDSIADLLALPAGQRKTDMTYIVKSFYSDLPIEQAFYQYDPTYSKVNHNGGTILDPSHTSAPGQTGWWESTNTGTGCFVMMNADALPLNVLWFGARNNTNMLVPEYDSWGAFDAALRTTFWDHENSNVLINSVRKILTPTRFSNISSTGDALGFYVGKRVTDESAGWPLTASGVVWTSSDIANTQTNSIGRMVIFDGGIPITFHNNPIGVMKSPNDYLYRFKWTVAGLYNICVSGMGSTIDNYPAVLTNQKIVGDHFFARGVGGNSYASLESVTVEGGRVPYQIYPGVDDRVPGCFVIGVIVDNSAKGTNRSVDGGGIYSNCNTSKMTNINAMYCTGTSLFLSRSDDSTADANGCHFEFTNNMTATRAAIATINGGGQNNFYIQCAQTNFAAVHLTATAGVNTTRNNIEVGYVGDYAGGSSQAPLMFMDVLQAGSAMTENVLRSLGNNLPQENPNDLATPIEIHPLSPALNVILYSNYVTTTEPQSSGVISEVVYGLGVAIPLPLFRDYTTDFRNKAGETLPSGAKKVTYTLSDFLKSASVLGVWLEVEIWIRSTSLGADEAVYSKVLCTMAGGAPSFVNVAKKESTAHTIYDIVVDVVGNEIVFYLTAADNNATRVHLLVKRSIA